ncbi:MAG: PolC-type DNA polymerase III, partial [Anaerovorax sp.]
PPQFYAVYFTTKVTDFNATVILKGSKAVLERIAAIEIMGKNATKKEQDEVTVLEVAYEMYARGYTFVSPQFGKSKASNFSVEINQVVIPFAAIAGVGENAAKAIVEAFETKPFISVDDLRARAKANKTAVEALNNHGVLSEIPESDQISLF